jgi:hypothetical protein
VAAAAARAAAVIDAAGMTTRAWGILLALAGAALLVVSAFADPIGIGGTDEFGWKQIAGSVVGVVLLVGGVGLAFLPVRGEVEPGAEE